MRGFLAFILAAVLLTVPVLASGPDSRSPDPDTCSHHFEVSVVREATCAEKGLLAYTCAKCGLTYTAETLPDGQHDYRLTETTATCTQDGEATYVCARCGDSYSEPDPATGHTPDGEGPTCEQGVTCLTCGELLEKPLGHDYVYQYDAEFDEEGQPVSYGTWACTRCGAVMDATRGNMVHYYELPEANDSDTDLPQPTADPACATDGAVTAPAASDGPEDGQEQPDPKTGLWIGISVAALVLIVAEAVVLIRSLKKNKTTL